METQRINISKIMLLVTLFLIANVVVAILFGGRFYNVRNMTSMGFQIGEFAFLCMAMALAMLTGGIDLSVVANMNLAGVLAGFVLTNDALVASIGPSGTVLLAVVVALVSGLTAGIFNGFLIAKIGIHSVLATIGTMMFFAGIGMVLTGGRGVVGFPTEFAFIGNGSVAGFPFPFLLMIVAFLIVGFFLNRSNWGKSLYLFGSNSVASRFSGIRNQKTILITYAIGGLLCAFSALILISRSNSARIGFGESYLLQAVVVSVMGTMDPKGGSGRFSGIFISVLLLQLLSSAFTRLGVTPFARGLVYGSILLLIIIAYELLSGREVLMPVLRKAQISDGTGGS